MTLAFASETVVSPSTTEMLATEAEAKAARRQSPGYVAAALEGDGDRSLPATHVIAAVLGGSSGCLKTWLIVP